MVNWIPRIDEAWRDKTFHITLEITQQRPGYKPGEEPRWGENRGPSCQGLPGSVRHPGEPLDRQPLRRRHQPLGLVAGSALPSMFSGTSGQSIVGADSGLAGTEGEQDVVAALLSPNGQRSAITTLLAGPMLRGTVVNQR